MSSRNKDEQKEVEKAVERETLNQEDWSGGNNPYRGIQDHGVKVDHYKYNEEYNNDSKPGIIEYENIEHYNEPIGVYIVNALPRNRERKACRIFRMTVNDNVVMLIGRNEFRTKLIIQNANASDTLWLSHDMSLCRPEYAFPLGGTRLELTTQEPLYGFRNNATQMSYDIIEEYVIEL